MLTTLFHVLLLVSAIIGLLTIKQRRMRHIPTRRTHISRRSAEGTIWVQRAVNAALDMLHCALAEQSKGNGATPSAAAGASSGSPDTEAPSSSSLSGTAAGESPKALSGKRVSPQSDESDSDSGAEVPSDLPFLNTLKAQLEEQISALLEDKGIASFADFRIRDWGGRPPLLKAVYLSHGGGAGASNNNNNNSSNSNTNNAPSNLNNSLNSSSGGGGGVNGGSNASTNASNIEGALAGQRVGSDASVTGSPNSLDPQHYPSSFGGNQMLPASMASRSSSSTLFPHNSPNPPPGERAAAEVMSSMDAPYAGMGMRYRSTNSAALNSGEEVGTTGNGVKGNGRERSLAGSMVHPGRLNGGNGNNNSSSMSSGMNAADLGGNVGLAGATTSSAPFLAADKNTSDTTRSLSVLEAEVEVEYSGNFSVSLNADVPVLRGRYLQVYAAISDVRIFAAHVRLRLALEYEPATVESPQPQPYLLGTLWLVSDPVFDVAFHSSLTQYRIRDFFLIPKLLKVFLLRFVRTKLRPTSSPSSSSASATAASRHANARRRRQSNNANAAGGGGAGGGGGVNAQGGGVGPGTSADAAAADSDRAQCDASGLSFRIQLPADVVDGGEQWWSAMARDTMSERPAPFLRSYHQ
ncbi:hypothetical protein NQL31_003963 [Lotmaria passim]